jgi:hypothetical protein
MIFSELPRPGASKDFLGASEALIPDTVNFYSFEILNFLSTEILRSWYP